MKSSGHSAPRMAGPGTPMGLIYVIVGPAGVGKGAVVRGIMEVAEKYRLVLPVSCTTRLPRAGEIHGQHYHFLSDGEFEDRVAKGHFAETSGHQGRRYGTTKADIFDRLNSGANVILEIDTEGAAAYKQMEKSGEFPGLRVITIFIKPPSFEALEIRLRGRGTEEEGDIRARLDRARMELEVADDTDLIDYHFVNGQDLLHVTVDEVLTVIRTHSGFNGSH